MKRLLTFACSLVLLADTAAYAEPAEPTAQAKAANAAFLLHAVPPAPPAAICLVDTGVNANPDTSHVASRYSVHGLDGTDTSPSLHGTRIAMLLGAVTNQWGMTGFWPSVPVVSVQVNSPGQEGIPTGSYLSGMYECNRLTAVHPIKVTLVTIASDIPLSDAEAAALHEIMAQARDQGISVIIAAGNLDGRPVGTPANVAGALSVGSFDATSGALCAGSASGAMLLAPGCAITSVDPATGLLVPGVEGTSASAAFVAASVAAIRTWRPDLSPQQIDRLLNESGTDSPSGRRLDLAAAFTNAGLGGVTMPPAPPPPPPAPVAKERLVMPRVSVRLKRRLLTIQASNRPAGSRMIARVYVRTSKGKFRKIAARTSAAAKVRVRVKRWSRVSVRFVDPTGARTASPTRTVTKRR